MKTFDEVINSMEACVYEKCYYASDCAYSDLAFGEISCVTKAIPAMMTDALHYLKLFRDYQNSAEMKINSACISDMENNPLIWDELKQMEGKPVWVEYEGYKPMWDIVDKIIDKRTIETYKCMLHDEGIGIHWQAYRKER